MLGSAGAQATRGGPVFFFDQPTRRNRIKGNILNFMIRSAGPQLEDAPLRCQQEEDQEGESNTLSNQNPSGAACEDEERDPSSSSVSAAPKDPLDAYRRAAPHLLNDLARLLSQHQWSEEDRIPRGVVNILNYSWHDLTAGAALRLRRPAAMTENRRRSGESLKTQKTPRREETGERSSYVERNAGAFLAKDKANQSERKEKRSSRGVLKDEQMNPKWLKWHGGDTKKGPKRNRKIKNEKQNSERTTDSDHNKSQKELFYHRMFKLRQNRMRKINPMSTDGDD